MIHLRKKRLLLLLLIAFTVNAALVLAIIPVLSKFLCPLYGISFSDGYDQLAMNLVKGNGYRFFPETAETLMREPGYPIFLSGIFVIFGYSLSAARFANLVLALGIAWLMTRIAQKLSSSNVVILASPLLFLFHPGTVIAECRGTFEILFTFLLMWFILMLYRAIETGNRSDYLVAGSILGLGVLVRSTAILFPAFVLVYLLFAGPNKTSRRAILANVGAMIVAMLVILSPWMIRNYIVVERFVPTTSLLGVAAHTGQYICKHHSLGDGFQNLDSESARQRRELAKEHGYSFKDGYFQYFYSSKDEIEFNRFLWKRAVKEYLASPVLFLKCTTSNLYNFWVAGKSWRATALNMMVQLPYLLLAIAGTFICLRNGRGKRVGPIILFIIYFVSVYLPIFAQARHSIPLIPFLAILGSFALGATWEVLTGKGRGGRLPIDQ